ncbi:MAG: S8 family serine peptidase [Bdellovibrionales bacterium]|nr:S8 family serine peptidase [Bdellovibrionales bacterium]
MKKKVFCFAFLGLTAILGESALAAGKKRPADPVAPAPVFEGKRVVTWKETPLVQVELPNGENRAFGDDFVEKLKTKFQNSGKFIVADPVGTLPRPVLAKESHKISSMQQALVERYVWPGSYTPVAQLKLKVHELSLRTGERGEKTFYGFDRQFTTPFNDGIGKNKNDFPLKKISFEPNWFERTFDESGKWPFDSHTGLDLGSGFRLEAFFAWLSVKHASYRVGLEVEWSVEDLWGNPIGNHPIAVEGKGYFFDVAGAYAGYSVGIQVARSDAFLKASTRAIERSLDELIPSLGQLPLLAKVDGTLIENPGTPQEERIYFLGTGLRSQIAAGMVYEWIDDPRYRLTIAQSFESGSIAKADPKFPIPVGAILRQIQSSSPTVLASLNAPAMMKQAQSAPETKNIVLPDENLPRPQFKDGDIPKENFFKVLGRSLVETIFLPYRWYRYAQYDRAYKVEADEPDQTAVNENGEEEVAESRLEEFVNAARKQGWARQIGLSKRAPSPVSFANPEERPVVAVLDTGMDYNHPVLKSMLRLDLNPGVADRYGWDFVSHDSRPADDAENGTVMSGVITALMPEARILPIKVFNPYGITTSASLYAGVRYAISKQAKIVLLGWGTRVQAEVFRNILDLVDQSDVLLVVPAGDRGDRLEDAPIFPAALAGNHPGLLAVASVDSNDHLLEISGHYSNYSDRLVEIAAPGSGVTTLLPRGRKTSKRKGTSIAAAAVAGALARLQARFPGDSAASLKHRILSEADTVAPLNGKVRSSKRLHIAE